MGSEEVNQVGPRSSGEDLEGAQRRHAGVKCGNSSNGEQNQAAQVQVPGLPLPGGLALGQGVAFTCFVVHTIGVILSPTT